MGQLISGARSLALDTLQDRAARAAAGLAGLGLGAGDLVALYLRNDLPFFEASAAAGLLGAYPTPVNWHYTPDEAAYLFENSGAKAIVIHADLIPPIREATVFPSSSETSSLLDRASSTPRPASRSIRRSRTRGPTLFQSSCAGRGAARLRSTYSAKARSWRSNTTGSAGLTS